MTGKDSFNVYLGDGSKAAERKVQKPAFEKPLNFDKPEHYFASEGLRAAVNLAICLGQPLLVTGEPGTGKTRLAASIANEFDFKLLEFYTKSNSTAKDLFYRYDALSHFHDAQFNRHRKQESGKEIREEPDNLIAGQRLTADVPEIKADSYITYEALGLAVLLSLAPDSRVRQQVNRYLPDKSSQVRSVVLIDEIDKAPRDFPNDILNEIDAMAFSVNEINSPVFKAEEDYRPIVILTSNSEKSLPDAFLRRCVFYYIDFPDTETLTKIVNERLGNLDQNEALIARKDAIRFFEQIRSLNLRKKPATAELLNWLRILEKIGINSEDEKSLIPSLSILLKNREDIAAVTDQLSSLKTIADKK